MAGKLDAARHALKAFIENSHSDDEFFFIGFNDRANLLAEFGTGEPLLRRLEMLNARGQTALYDSIYLGIEKAAQGRHWKRALLIISDGDDNASRYTIGQLRQRVKEAGVQLYCIGIGHADLSDKAARREEQRGRMILDELAALTGGRAIFIGSTAAMEEAASRVALELRQQYALGYSPTNRQYDGRWRKIRVRVNGAAGQLASTVRAKEGYYSPPF
jgi:Ca-activated chloride channel family protein